MADISKIKTINGTTYNIKDTTARSVMTGASASSAGSAGRVPAPSAGDNEKFLRGDGTWAEASGGGSGGSASSLGSLYYGTITAISNGELTATVEGYTSYTAGDMFILNYPSTVSNPTSGGGYMTLKVNNLSAQTLYYKYTGSSPVDYKTVDRNQAQNFLTQNNIFTVYIQKDNNTIRFILNTFNKNNVASPLPLGDGGRNVSLLGIEDANLNYGAGGPLYSLRGNLVFDANNELLGMKYNNSTGTRESRYFLHTSNIGLKAPMLGQYIPSEYWTRESYHPYITVENNGVLEYDFSDPLVTVVGRIWLVDSNQFVYQLNREKLMEYFNTYYEMPENILPYFTDILFTDENQSDTIMADDYVVRGQMGFSDAYEILINDPDAYEAYDWTRAYNTPYAECLWRISASAFQDFLTDNPGYNYLTMTVTNNNNDLEPFMVHDGLTLMTDLSDVYDMVTNGNSAFMVWNCFVNIEDSSLMDYCNCLYEEPDDASAGGFMSYGDVYEATNVFDDRYEGLTQYIDFDDHKYKVVPPNCIIGITNNYLMYVTRYRFVSLINDTSYIYEILRSNMVALKEAPLASYSSQRMAYWNSSISNKVDVRPVVSTTGFAGSVGEVASNSTFTTTEKYRNGAVIFVTSANGSDIFIKNSDSGIRGTAKNSGVTVTATSGKIKFQTGVKIYYSIIE